MEFQFKSKQDENRVKHHLKNIMAENKIRDDRSAQAVKIYKPAFEKLLELMKQEDPLFRELSSEAPLYVGSYFSGLRVNEPNEFDIDLVLQLPFSRDDIVLNEGPPGYATFELNDDLELLIRKKPQKALILQKLSRLFNGGKLNREKLLSWFQSVLQRGMLRLPQQLQDIITCRKSGPAFTLTFEVEQFGTIDVDLVPTIRFRGELPPGARDYFKYIVINKNPGFLLIPKGSKRLSDDEHLFRIALSETESELILDKGCIKMIIKLFKILRDCQGWDTIASYHIKMMFITQLMDTYVDATEYWHEKNLGKLFMEMLQVFYSSLAEQSLPMIFYPELNLYDEINSATMFNICQRVAKMIKDIKSDVDNVRKYFVRTQPTQQRASGADSDEEMNRMMPRVVEDNDGWGTAATTAVGVLAVGGLAYLAYNLMKPRRSND